MNTRLVEKYTGRNDTCEHLSHWTTTWGEEPQPKWVHIFFHMLHVIPMNLYLETELRYGTIDRNELKESFILNFSFEDVFECIDDAL